MVDGQLLDAIAGVEAEAAEAPDARALRRRGLELLAPAERARYCAARRQARRGAAIGSEALVAARARSGRLVAILHVSASDTKQHFCNKRKTVSTAKPVQKRS